jgi:sugar O-acyltransferase (sialic acid O-acetyltransferase NeuD family)
MSAAVTRLLVLGTGGNCLDILDTMRDINDAEGRAVYECVGFLDDDPSRMGREFLGARVVGTLRDAGRFPDCRLVNGIGSSANFRNKPAIIARTGAPIERFATLIHPTASVSRTAKIGRGVVLLQHVTVATNAHIGDHVIVLPSSIVSHDSRVGSYSCIAGGVCISGFVDVGECCYLGTNACLRERVAVGTGSLVGMGSAVLRNVDPDSVVVGNPARPLGTVEGARPPGAGGAR